MRDHLLLTIMLTSGKMVPIIEPPPLVAPCRLEQQVCNLVDIFELGTPSEKHNLVDQGRELPFKGGDQGLLLLKGQAEKVAMVMSQTEEVVLGKMLKKSIQYCKNLLRCKRVAVEKV